MNRALLLLIIVWLSAAWTFAQNSGQALLRQDGQSVEKPYVSLEKQVNLYPNPTKEYLNVEILSPELKQLSFAMYDIIGNPVDVKLAKVYENKYRIEVTTYIAGYYILMIKDKGSDFSQAFRFLKE